MLFRESDKYRAETLRAFGLLLSVPLGQSFLAMIFEFKFYFFQLVLSLMSFLLSLFLIVYGYRVMKTRDKRSLKKRGNDI